MKIAIPTMGRSLDSDIAQRFGRAPWLLIVDTRQGCEEALPNDQNQDADQGAGIQAARAVVAHDSQVLLTGHCGPKAYEILQRAGVFVYTGIEGTAAEALGWLAGGFLVPSGKSDREQHWT